MKRIGQQKDENGKCSCQRCGKRLVADNFYTYKDGSKCEICKPCLTAHVDNFSPPTFEWILEKMDVPYVPSEWDILRDKAFARDPYKMNGMSIIGKYLAKMRLIQWNKYGYKDSERIQKEMAEAEEKKKKEQQYQKERYQAELKVKLNEGKISPAQYQTLVSTETQYRELPRWGDPITGEYVGQIFAEHGRPESYEDALRQVKNPYKDFIPEKELIDLGADLSKDDKIYLAMKWGRLYKPNQWVVLEQLYNEFMNSFDIQGAARIDTLKMICKTSLKMNEAIDSGDIQGYQRLARVYDSMMKSAKFTQAQNKDKDGTAIDSASAIVDFVETHGGAVPKYKCDQPQDLIDTIITDLKEYNKNLIYEDKSLAQEIQKFLTDKKNAEEIKKDRQEAKKQGISKLQLKDEDFTAFNDKIEKMKQQDEQNELKILEGEKK